MAEPKVQVAVKLPVKTYERLKRLAKAQQSNHTAVLIKLIGDDQDDATTRRAQSSVKGVKA